MWYIGAYPRVDACLGHYGICDKNSYTEREKGRGLYTRGHNLQDTVDDIKLCSCYILACMSACGVYQNSSNIYVRFLITSSKVKLLCLAYILVIKFKCHDFVVDHALASSKHWTQQYQWFTSLSRDNQIIYRVSSRGGGGSFSSPLRIWL